MTLDDVSEANGTVYLLPYSRAGTREVVPHKENVESHDIEGYFGSDPGDPVIVPAGSIAVFSSTVLHRSGFNRTPNWRRVYLPQYSAEPLRRPDGKLAAFAEPFLVNGERRDGKTEAGASPAAAGYNCVPPRARTKASARWLICRQEQADWWKDDSLDDGKRVRQIRPRSGNGCRWHPADLHVRAIREICARDATRRSRSRPGRGRSGPCIISNRFAASGSSSRSRPLEWWEWGDYHVTANEICAVYVDPDFIGQGIGRALFQVVTDALRARGFTEAVLDASITVSVGFYKAMGCRVVEQRLHTFRSPGVSIPCVRMVMSIVGWGDHLGWTLPG